MPDAPVHLSTGLPETVLPPPSPEASARLDAAVAEPPERRRDAVSGVVATFPRYLDAWARLGSLAQDDAEAEAVLGRARPREQGRGDGFAFAGLDAPAVYRHRNARARVRLQALEHRISCC